MEKHSYQIRMKYNSCEEKGFSLVLVLMILAIVSILGAGAAQIVIMAERTARNDRDYQLAWQSADAALLDAEFDISGGTGFASARSQLFTPGDRFAFVASCGDASSGTSKGLCLPSTSGKPVWLTADMTGSGARSVEFGSFTGRAFDATDPASISAGTAALKPSSKPRYLIEVLDDLEVFGDQAVNRSRPPALVYRVTAMGFGPRSDIQAVVQMLYRKD